MKKNLFILSFFLLSLMFVLTPAQAVVEKNSQIDNQAEFGSCYADPIYQISYPAQTVISSNVRNVACMEDSQVSFVLPANTKIEVIAKTDGWHKIKTNNGKTGWIGSTLIKDISKKADKLISNVKPIKELISETTNRPKPINDLVVKKMLKRLSGQIILAVEKKGEAYYVTEEGEAIYMKNGNSAFDIMRKLGLGISNDNLNKLQKGDQALKNRLSGKIVLAVEKHGEAYYINPSDLKIYYLKDGPAAFEIMRNKGLGISNANLSKISKKETSQIKKQVKEQAKEQAKEQLKEEVKNKLKEGSKSSESNNNINLTAIYTSEGVELNWQTNFISDKGFKVLISEKENPVYPGNDYHYFPNKNTASDVWNISSPGTYYFRVCEYLGGKCGVYSNNEIITIK